jgi:predicted ArsR family transcriptional regulator
MLRAMMHSSLSPLDETGAEQQRAALAFVTEAYAEAILAGIESDSFAHAALAAALRELVAAHGEENVAAFMERLPARLRDGEFSLGAKH